MSKDTFWLYRWGYSYGADVRAGLRTAREWRNADGSPIAWETSGKPFPRGYRDGLAGRPEVGAR